MTFFPNLIQGQESDNNELREIFKCGPQGGIRKSNRTNTVVLIHDEASIYGDKWKGDIFHFTGAGLRGSQELTKLNKVLLESNKTNTELFLFKRIYDKHTYVYEGKVELSGAPIQEEQDDIDGIKRKVWVFHLKMISDETIPLTSEVNFLKEQDRSLEKAAKSTDEELLQRLNKSSSTVETKKVISVIYPRNADVVIYTLRRAKGFCQLCRNPAPFIKKDGTQYLETHHIQWLSKEGSDTIQNTVALCPNCHKKMHVLDLQADKDILYKSII
jgi:5-methylcytosine-specific restriction enzyme A